MIAAAVEKDVLLYDPTLIREGKNAETYKNSTHTSIVRGLDFNPIRKNLLLSASLNGEVG
jgi:WD40 repeat protein